MKNKVALRICAVAIVGSCVIGVGANAASAQPRSGVLSLVVNEGGAQLPGGLSLKQWEGVARNAETAGDPRAAADVRRLIAVAQESHTSRTESIPSSIAKKALIALLRHGGPALAQAVKKLSPRAGAWLARNSGRLADILETVTNWQKGPIIWALQHAGIPFDIANDLADWIVFFIGV